MDPLSVLFLYGCLSGYAAGAAAGLLFQCHPKTAVFFAFGGASFAAACGIACSILALVSGTAASSSAFLALPSFIPHVPLAARLDPLSAFFVLIVSFLGVALSLYSFGYSRGYFGRKNVGSLGALFNLLLLSTTLVFIAGNLWLFLGAWELMALAAYCLVSFEHESPETRRAGVLFFIMSHLDAACIMLGLLLLFQASGNFSFASFHGIGARLPPFRRDVAFVLFLLGFGIKAGVVPLHVWLPAAHPVAPSNVSAAMSGVLIKTGIYGLVRVCFDFLGPAPLWWGVAVLVIGTVSAVLGVLYALMEHDLKRLLAYHSIENIGIILMGVGAALMFQTSGHPILAALALAAALYHTINHASFKGLLFLGAGAVVHATHTRNMEEMGGLAKRMPQTAFLFLVGAAAISALPPLNGFVSEWLTFQALLQGFGTTQSVVRLIFPLGGAMLALTGALAAACFVKAYGITFLAQPRSERAAEAREAAPTMRAGMAILAGACAFLGLFPTVFLRILDPVTLNLTGESLAARLSWAGGLVLGSLSPQGGSVSTLGLAAAFAALLAVPIVLTLVFARSAKTRRGPTWDCGLRGLTPRMEYTATGFSKPIRMVFKALFRPRREVQREYDYSPYFATSLRFDSRVEEVFETRIYRPLRAAILRVSRRIRAIQAGSIHLYLLYIFLALLGLLLFAR